LGLGDSAEDGYEEIRVPFIAEGELKVVIAAVEMMAQGRLDVPRWRPTRSFALADGYDSDEEIVRSQRPSNFINLRRVNERPIAQLESRELPKLPWMYRPQEKPFNVRAGGYINSQRCKDALVELEKCLLEYRVPSIPIVEVEESGGGTVTPINVEGFGDVESPGGSVVCSLPVKICEKMNEGRTLKSDEFLRVISAARVDVDRFVASKLFDCYAGPWESLLVSLLDDSVASAVVRSGLSADTYLLVDRLRSRLSIEVCSVFAMSNVFEKRFLRIFSAPPSMDSMMSAIKDGKFNGIAQTDGFLDRVVRIKHWIDEVLLSAERQNVYLPTYITSAQRGLPIRGKSRLGYVGSGMNPMPEKVARRIEDISRTHKRRVTFGDRAAGW